MHKNRKWNGILAMVVALAMLSLASCGAGNGMALIDLNSNDGAQNQSADDSRGLPGLPQDDSPSGRSASAVETFAGDTAIDFLNGLPGQGKMVLSSTADENAWALYQIGGLSDRKVENLSIQALINGGEEFSVGLSNYSDGVWDFLLSSSGGVFDYDLTAEQSRLTSKAGNLFVVVVVDNAAQLDIIQLSVDSRPLEAGEELRPGKGRRLSVSEGLPDKIVVQWESVDGALSTELWRELDLDGEDEASLLIATIPVEAGKTNYSYEDMDVLLSVEYKYRIRAINGTGPGSFSLEESGWAGTTAPVGEDFENEFEVRGTIELIVEGSLTVAGVDFVTDESTIWLGDNDEILSRADFSAGQTVEVNAEQFGTEQWIARTVELEDGVVDEIKVLGLIEEITETTITVDGTGAAHDETTEWLDGNNLPALPADFLVGMNVEMTLDADGSGGWLARKVKMEDGNEGVNDELSVLGVIDEITETSITVDGYTASFDELTEWLDDNKDPALPTDFSVGMEVELTADADGLGGWHARVVSMEDIGGGLHEIDVIGEIEFLDAGLITVAGQSFNVTVDTIWLDGDKNPLTIDDFSIGMLVDVAGEADGLGGWDAVDVEIVN